MTQGAVAARRLTMIVVVAALGVAGLGGCGKDEAPPSPSSSSSLPAPTSASPTPTPTPSPEPTPPAKPATWTQSDEAAALDAAQYFMDLYNYVIATGDLTEWSALADPECTFCRNVSTRVSGVQQEGHHLVGGAITTTERVVAGYDATLGIFGIQLHYATEPVSELDSSGALVSESPAQSAWVILDVGFTGDRWNLVEGDARDEPAA